MYKIEIPIIFRPLVGICYRLGIWSDTDLTNRERFRNSLYFIFAVAFVISVALGAYTTSDGEECIFLSAVTVEVTLSVYRMWFIVRRKIELVSFLRQIGTHNTPERSEFDQMSKTLSVFMKFVRNFLLMIFLSLIFGAILFPFINNDKKLIINIRFPSDRTNSTIAFWIKYVFHSGGCAYVPLSTFLTAIIWYLMLSFSIEYKLLGGQLERMGTIRMGDSQLKVSLAQQQKLYQKDLYEAMQTYNKINEVLKQFGTHFATLFFVQVATSSVGICGAVYTLAFSSHANSIINFVYCSFLSYCIFNTFIVMYLGNEIKLSSDELSHCLYNSNWIEQTQSCKRSVLIFGERLKQPHELIVGKIYPLNLLTFTSIINSAYSMFNILQNLRQ